MVAGAEGGAAARGQGEEDRPCSRLASKARRARFRGPPGRGPPARGDRHERQEVSEKQKREKEEREDGGEVAPRYVWFNAGGLYFCTARWSCWSLFFLFSARHGRQEVSDSEREGEGEGGRGGGRGLECGSATCVV